MENATRYPSCIASFLWLSPMTLKRPLSLDCPDYMPGNRRHGVWFSRLLERVMNSMDFPTDGGRRVSGLSGSFVLGR
jgi:hypothetical protein